MAIFPLAPDQTIAQMWSSGARGGKSGVKQTLSCCEAQSWVGRRDLEGTPPCWSTMHSTSAAERSLLQVGVCQPGSQMTSRPELTTATNISWQLGKLMQNTFKQFSYHDHTEPISHLSSGSSALDNQKMIFTGYNASWSDNNPQLHLMQKEVIEKRKKPERTSTDGISLTEVPYHNHLK